MQLPPDSQSSCGDQRVLHNQCPKHRFSSSFLLKSLPTFSKLQCCPLQPCKALPGILKCQLMCDFLRQKSALQRGCSLWPHELLTQLKGCSRLFLCKFLYARNPIRTRFCPSTLLNKTLDPESPVNCAEILAF